MGYIRFSFETSSRRGDEATMEILQTDIFIGGNYNVEMVDYGGVYGWGDTDPFRIVGTTELFDIQDIAIAEILTEMSTRTKSKLYMLMTNEDKSKHRFIVAGTTKLIADKYYEGPYDPSKLSRAGHKPDDLIGCIHKWDDLKDVDIYAVG